MSMFSEKVFFIGSASAITGVVSEPKFGSSGRIRTGVILLNAGLVHHVGPNRLSVRIARQLAAMGHLVARFDHRGIGDSGLRHDDRPFSESAVEETVEVMNHLQQQYDVDSFWLMGICSGAMTALGTTLADERVSGAVLINGSGWGKDNVNLYVYNRRWARHYWKRSLFNVDSWKRFFMGQIQYRLLAIVLVRQLRDRLKPAKEVKAISSELSVQLQNRVDSGVRFLLVMSQGDPACDYVDAVLGSQVRELEATGNFRREVVPYADHIFTPQCSQQHLIRAIADWIGPGLDVVHEHRSQQVVSK